MYLNINLIQFFKQKTTLKISLLVITLFVINGCASLSKGECNTGDWQNIGAKDGSRGLVANAELKKHQSACSKYKIRPNNEMYYSGYKQGIRQFCQHKVGFSQGSQGSKYLASCPATLERNFLKGYIPGLELAMDNIENDIDELRHRRYRLNKKLDHLYRSGSYRGKDKFKDYEKNKDKDKDKNKGKHKDIIKKLEGSLDSVESRISSKRSTRNKLRSWHSRLVSSLK